MLQPGAAAQTDVILVAQGRPAASYRAVAMAFKDSGQAQAPQYAANVAALAPAERKLVTDALTASGAAAALASVKRLQDTGLPRAPDGKPFDTASPFPH